VGAFFGSVPTLPLQIIERCFWMKKDSSAAPEGRPGGGSRTYSVNFTKKKSLHPTAWNYLLRGRHIGGEAPGA
jgi:hypothetical protein